MQTGITGKLLRAWCASPSGSVLLQTLLGHSSYQQRPALPLEASSPTNTIGQAGTDYRTQAWQHHSTAAAVLPSSLPNLQAQEDPPLQSHHSYSSCLAESSHFHMLSHSEGAKEEALPTKITPLANNYTAHVAHRPSSAPKKKANIITLFTHCSHFLCQKPSEKEPPICRKHVGKLFTPTQDIQPDLPGLSTYLQFPLASHCSGCRCCQLLRSVPQRLPSEAGQ